MNTYRIAVLADIHGNLPAFEAVMADIDRHPPCDALLAAGDVTGGPGQEAVLQRLADQKAVMVQGNGERSIARLIRRQEPDYVYTAKQFTLTRWAAEHLSPASLEFLLALPEQRALCLPGAESIRMVHGSPRSVSELIYPGPEEDKDFSYRTAPLLDVIGLVPEPVMVFGHSHDPWVRRVGHRLALNPGAVSFPANGFIGAQYAFLVWDGSRWEAELHAIPYDLDRLRRDYEESGFLDTGPLARAILHSIFTGVDDLPALFGRARRLAQEAGCANLPYFPDEIWERAGEAFALL